jgi:hypothetical protein
MKSIPSLRLSQRGASPSLGGGSPYEHPIPPSALEDIDLTYHLKEKYP